MLVSRQQIWLTSLAGIFLLAAVGIFAVFAFSPTTAVIYGPILLTAFVVALFIGMVCIAWLLRGLLRPYNQLVGEAKRAPVAHSGKSQNEAAFVLETFQSVIAQLQAQQNELERLSAQATQRADSAEQLSEITEVTRLREQVTLKRNLESLGEMSAGLAHEFKNAMAALQGYAQFLQSVDHDERGKAAADALVQEVRTLSEMITSFLNFARPQPLQ